MYTIAFDLDDVLCTRDRFAKGKVDKYRTCTPNHEMIKIVNQCWEAGYRIIIFTARGMTGFNGNVHLIYTNLFDLTQKQLNDWGVKYHQLIMGKAHYDLLVDDKAVNSRKIQNLKDIECEIM